MNDRAVVPINLATLTDKQRAAVQDLLDELELLQKTRPDYERKPILQRVLQKGVLVHRMKKKLVEQLESFDATLREKYPPDPSTGMTTTPSDQDDLWISNLRRLEGLDRVLAQAEAMQTVLDDAERPFTEMVA